MNIMFAIDYSYLADDIEKQVRKYGYTLGKTRKWVQNMVLGVNIAYVHGYITKSERQKILKRIHNRIVKDLLKPIKEKNMTHDVIKYTSDNGYTGTLYGKSSLSIRDKNGKEKLHTGFRNINTYDELVKIVEDFPRFYKMLTQIDVEDIDEDDDI